MRWGFTDGFKPLFSLVCRCRWNVLCVKKIKNQKRTKNGRVWGFSVHRDGVGGGTGAPDVARNHCRELHHSTPP